MNARAPLLVALLIALGVGLAVAWDGSGDAQTYRNEALGYELRFPDSWQIEVQSPSASASGARGQQEYVRLSGPDSDGAPSVIVAVNYDARWCETGLGQEVTVVYVSGIAGEQYLCSMGDGYACRPAPACRIEPYQMVWNFPGERGRLGYVILGTPGNDLTAIRRVFESFRFN